MSLPMRQAATKTLRSIVGESSSSTLPLSPLRTKTRLFRIPHEALPRNFFSAQSGSLLGSSKYFFLFSQRLSDETVRNINRGPPWLVGPYPPGLLQARHEKRRLINHTPMNNWREGNESENDHLRWEEEKKALSMIRLPLLDRFDSKNDKIPFMIITSKKKVHKLAVVRQQIRRRIGRAFDQAVRQLQESSAQLPADSETLFLFTARKEAQEATFDELTAEIIKLLQRYSAKKATKSEGSRYPVKDKRLYRPQAKLYKFKDKKPL